MTRALIFLLALLGATALDAWPERPAVTRGGRRVLEADLHVHTRVSDGFMSAIEVPFAARRAGLDVVAVTDHNTARPSLLARRVARALGGPIVLSGEELTTASHHVIVLGIERTISASQPLARALLEVHAQRGVAIAAHPSERFWPAFAPVMTMLDGAEVMHPVRRWGGGESFERFFARLAAARERPAAVGSSDLHAMNGLGAVRTLLFVDEVSERGALEALRAGRTVVRHDDGRMTGDAEMVAALEAEPLAPPAAPSYVAGGLADAGLRTIAWVALAALLFTRRSRLLS